MAFWPTTAAGWATLGGGVLEGASKILGGGQKRPRISEHVKNMLGTKTYDRTWLSMAQKLGLGGRVGSNIPLYAANALDAHVATRSKMASAKQLGIHPLMALGMPASGSSAVSISGAPSSDSFSRFASAGADISRAIAAGQSNMERLQERLLEAQIEGQEIDNVMRASQTRTAYGQPGMPPGLPVGRDPRYPEQLAMPMGYGDTAPLLRKGRDARGDSIRVYNDDLGDNEILQAVTAVIHSLPDMVANAGRRTGDWLRKPQFSRKWAAPWSR